MSVVSHIYIKQATSALDLLKGGACSLNPTLNCGERRATKLISPLLSSRELNIHTTHSTNARDTIHTQHRNAWRCRLATQSRARIDDARLTQARATRGQTPEGAVSRRTTKDPEYRWTSDCSLLKNSVNYRNKHASTQFICVTIA